LRDVGVQQYINLPRIAVLGSQSAGKSSVLESIVGLDFLPRGEGVVTRRPLELRLCHIPEGPGVKPWGIFAEKKDEKFFDFTKVRETIEELTDKRCGTKKNIVDDPIVLNIYSPTCPDLTLIDLPGITKIPIEGQDPNIKKITKEMAARYCKDPLTIILCVTAANQDITTSDGLQMAREIDPEGIRTIGVLTKLDIMDAGTDARKALLNQEVPLKLGYVGVKNRSKQDLMDKIPMKEALDKERDFFNMHPVYRKLPPGYLGTDILIQKLTKLLFKKIREILPTVIKEINSHIKQSEEELSLLGQPLPVDDIGKLNLLWTMLSEYCETYRNVIKGKYDSKRLTYVKDEGGYKIKQLFKELLEEFTGDYKATANYTVFTI
jgi:GTP-binding protein EngB required for normal cell division